MTKFDLNLIFSEVLDFFRRGFHPGSIALLIFFTLLCLGTLNTAGEVEATLQGKVLSVRSTFGTIESGAGGFATGTMMVDLGAREVNLGFSGPRQPEIGDRVHILRHKNRFYGKSLSYGGIIKGEN